ncbi:hypothetical protein AURDEDRAFT_165681 [Auricularia subglabra TFB-10046 SS5]|nr:hypothetical protein AURDEDRAFT_165681 [Auricularia subglabra TFB-10046 SS5]
MPPVANLAHICAVYFCLSETQASEVRKIRIEDVQPGFSVPIPRQLLFGSDATYLSRVWVWEETGRMKKFVVFFTMKPGSESNSRLRVDKALVLSVTHDEKVYLCLRSVRLASFILDSLRGHIAETKLHALRVACIAL